MARKRGMASDLCSTSPSMDEPLCRFVPDQRCRTLVQGHSPLWLVVKNGVLTITLPKTATRLSSLLGSLRHRQGYVCYPEEDRTPMLRCGNFGM
jgi:hypothetical protein